MQWIAPLVLAILGLASLWDGFRLVTTKQDIVGAVEAGGWIAFLGVILLVLTAVHVLRSGAVRAAGDTDAAAGENLHLVAIAFVMLAAFIGLMGQLGYLLATALFLAAYLKHFGRYGWLATLSISITFAVSSAYLWAVMNLMLPKGLIPWP